MLLASYKATRPGLQGLANRAIRLRLRGVYSHSEVVFEPSDGVADLMPDGSAAAGADGSLWCASSVAAEAMPAHSPRRAGKAGGVRLKRIALDEAHWDVQPLRGDARAAAQWFALRQGQLYDWQLILGWLIPQKCSRWTCSESVAAALGVVAEDAWRFDPVNLHAAARAWSIP